MSAPTLTDIRTWPAVVPVDQAATALGCSRSWLYARIKTGDAPVRGLRYGTRVVVVTASLINALEAS
ncbi:helix-turn-helix transcriptional regulator [Streptomyces albogriseolus]|uniref:helix-turn-helix transcriptional regulator n=1 Tax=Streptomyces albogriseolus TaxID=1887 RepID=UPI00345FD4D8